VRDDDPDEEDDERPTPLLSFVERQERAERLLVRVWTGVRLIRVVAVIALVVQLLTLVVVVVLLLARP
jgi:hypothetical protein